MKYKTFRKQLLVQETHAIEIAKKLNYCEYSYAIVNFYDNFCVVKFYSDSHKLISHEHITPSVFDYNEEQLDEFIKRVRKI